MSKVKVSIIIVNYKVEKQLMKCLASIKSRVLDVSYEVIVVENDPNTDLTEKIRKYEFAKYIRSSNNVGFGAGNNLGAYYASGDNLFFLNPDTEIVEGSILALLKFLSNKKVGIVAPVLLDRAHKEFVLQGTKKLTPVSAMFSLSFINKFFPNNMFARKYWLKGVDKSRPYQVGVVPGTAFMIKKLLFEKIGGFDENFFLYFEEMDLCNRVIAAGYKIYMNPDLKVIHLWGESTKGEKNINKIFEKSRFYYFKKYYGYPAAILTTAVLNLNLKLILLFLVVLLGAFLRLDRPGLMPFIPDQAWFYLSARDMIVNGNIPLVGITSSHTWLHQGPLWTYMLVPLLFLFRFNPIVGFYIAALFGIAAIILIYKLGKDVMNQEFGLIGAFLYAVSPLIVIHERFGYHTSPISFFTILLIYSLIKWVNGKTIFFATALFCMSILYNFELAIVVFIPVIILLLVYGFFKKTRWFDELKKTKIIILSSVALVFPMIPVLIYDVGNGFPQTIKYAAWLIYKPITSLLLESAENMNFFIFFTTLHISRLVFLADFTISATILITSIALVGIVVYKKIASPMGIVFLSTIIPIVGFIATKTASEAYLPMLFPGIMLCMAYLIYRVYSKQPHVGVLLIFLIAFPNAYLVYTGNYLMEQPYGYGWPIEKVQARAKTILKIAAGRPYNLEFSTPGYKISSSVANYEYLNWLYEKNPPSKKNEKIKLQIFDDGHRLEVRRIKK